MYIPPELFTIKEPTQEQLDIFYQQRFNDKTLHEVDSDFHDIRVIENEIGRFLLFDATYQAGIINTDFYSGNLPYINYFLLPYLLNQDIKNILLIGMGTGKIINDYEKLIPNIESIDIVDIDPDVVNIAQEYFGFHSSEKTDIHLQDGRVFMRNSEKKYDLVIIDIAGNYGIPFRFMTSEFLEEVKGALSEKGMIISNMFGSTDFEHKNNVMLKALKRTYESVFSKTSIFRCDYSDSIFYRAFIGVDYRIIDTTNILFLASNWHDENLLSYNAGMFEQAFKKLGIFNLKSYVNDVYKDNINTEGYKILSDKFTDDEKFNLENFKYYIKNEK